MYFFPGQIKLVLIFWQQQKISSWAIEWCAPLIFRSFFAQQAAIWMPTVQIAVNCVTLSGVSGAQSTFRDARAKCISVRTQPHFLSSSEQPSVYHVCMKYVVCWARSIFSHAPNRFFAIWSWETQRVVCVWVRRRADRMHSRAELGHSKHLRGNLRCWAEQCMRRQGGTDTPGEVRRKHRPLCLIFADIEISLPNYGGNA